MSTYLVPKSRTEHVHYNRDFKLYIPVSLGYVFCLENGLGAKMEVARLL